MRTTTARGRDRFGIGVQAALGALVVVACVTAPASAQAPADPTGRPLGRALDNLFAPPVGTPHRTSSSSSDLASNFDYVTLASGAEIPIADLKGSGIIKHLWLNVQSDDPYAGRLVVLRAKWDGENNASIEVPIGDFFGVGFGLDAPVDTLPVRVSADGRGRSCWWPMPFSSAAYVTLRNDSARPIRLLQWAVDWVSTPCPTGVRTFHAHFRTSSRDGAARLHKVLDVKGRGHYVGTVLSIWSGEEGWPGEGDDRFYVDSGDPPTLQGTGLEDYFGDAWGFHAGTGPFGGVTLFEGTGAGARSTAVRWHLEDPIAFDKSLIVTFERSGWVQRHGDRWEIANDRPDALSSVAFWYQEEPHGALTVLPPPSERLPFYEVRYEPEDKGVMKSITVADGAPPPVRQDGTFWAYGAQLQFTPPDRDKAKLVLPFDVPSIRDYDLYFRGTRSKDGGVWQAFIDGEPFGNPFDLYASPGSIREVLLGRLRLGNGGHVLELRAVGKNLESSGFALGFDSFMLRWYP